MTEKIVNKDAGNYAGAPLETPYFRAQQEWDNRMGSVVVQGRNWRLVAVLSLLTSVFLSILLGMSFAMHKNTVYVAQVTHGGRVVNVAPLVVAYQPNLAQKEYFVAHLISLMREVPLDPVVAKKDWMQAYYFLTHRGSEQFNQLMQKSNLLGLLGKKTVTVKIQNLNPLSDQSFEVDWIETTIDLQKEEKVAHHYSGIFTTVISQPTTEVQILQNPLGIYVDNFHISTRD